MPLHDTTPRPSGARAEDEAHAARIRRALEAAGIGTLDIDTATGRAVVSPAYDRIFGYPHPGRTWTLAGLLDHIAPAERPGVEAAVAAAVRDFGDIACECRIRRADGDLRWIELHGHAVAGPGAPRIAGIVTDIHERKRIETALVESERKFRVLADAMPQMIWSTRPDGYHDYYNSQWYAFTGAGEQATDGEGWNPMFHPDDQDRAWTRWRHSLETGDPYEIEYRLRHRSGDYRWVLGRALPIRDETGAIVRWFGTCTDIGDLKAAEAALRESEERLSLALSAGGVVGTWVWEIQADRVVADERFARLFSIDPEAAASGAPISDYVAAIHPEDRDRVGAEIEAAVATNGPYRSEYRVLQPDGTVRWVDARGRCEHDAAGRPLRFPGTVVDITDRRLAEEARDLVTRELSHRIKNIFAVVSSLITLSSRSDPAVRTYAQGLRARIDALAQAQNYVRPHSPESRPEGNGRETLHGLLALLVSPYEDDERRRFSIGGEDRPVGPHAAVALALILHELATNAVKYGALSTPAGQVSIDGRVEGGEYVLVWAESGGPPLPEPPTRQGFGTLMANRAATGQLGGTIAHDWHPEGLRLSLVVPESRLAR
jgi:PAS domain S-box-containing protein